MFLFKLCPLLFFSCFVLFAEWKVEPVSAAPAALPASLTEVLQKEGFKVVGENGNVFCEVWLRATPLPSAPLEDSATLAVPHGTFMGVIHFPNKGADRRGQPIQPGLYTMRLSFFPQNGDHQGVAPQRDFLVLTPLEADADPNATPGFEQLTNLSKKVSGTPHPAVFSMWKVDSEFKPGFEKMGESDWVLQAKIGDTPVAIILIGRAEA
ncbi:MAG: hypothetical protein NZV14_10550 [Bryobacteraceae bacterium]|nr:hypothetical protein [Bryobacteraceae bacterium]MDW8378593.1 hypothetical protein [Bryobacterales bacterium]